MQDRVEHHTDEERRPTGGWGVMAAVLAAVAVAAMGYLFVRSNAGSVASTPAMFDAGITTIADAQAAAGEDGLIFAFATADWCPPCQHYKRTALVDPAVEEWVRTNTTPLYVDVDHNRSDAQALNVGGIPQTTLMTSDGRVLLNEVGAIPAEQLLALLRDAAGKR